MLYEVITISAADGANDFTVTFDAVTGSDYEGDMSIDDFSVTGTSSEAKSSLVMDVEGLEQEMNFVNVYPNRITSYNVCYTKLLR